MFILGGVTKMMKKRDYRPKIHFSPEKGCMNDPNGMVYVSCISETPCGTVNVFVAPVEAV